MHYRVYDLGASGHIVKAVDLDCADDVHALVEARRVTAGKAELWQGGRLVGQVNRADFTAWSQPEKWAGFAAAASD